MNIKNNSFISKSTTPSGIPIYMIGGIIFVHIPEGNFTMGSTSENSQAHPNEMPQLSVYLPEYWMSRFLITNEQYIKFCNKSGYPDHGDWARQGKAKHPVNQVTWNDAVAFCEWFNLANKEELDNAGELRLFLPSEAEWEKAARGEDGREWPWGNEFDEKKCNSRGNETKDTTPVGKFSPDGDSPFGCADMAGNVWEYTRTIFEGHHTVDDDLKDDLFSQISIRGGAFGNEPKYCRCPYRDREGRDLRYEAYGFRVCLLSKEMTEKYIKQMIRF